MKLIILISCSANKKKRRAKVRDMYTGALFKYSLAYAEKLKPDKIFVLSALHHLLELNTEIEPYNVTLTYVAPKKRKADLLILDKAAKQQWAEKVVEMLEAFADLKNDRFIVLAGEDYVKPIRNRVTHIDEVLKGISLFDRIPYIKSLLNGK